MTRLFVLLCGILVGATSVGAHDFWLAAADWRPAGATSATITAGIGERFPSRTIFRARDNWLTEWRILGEAGDVHAPAAWGKAGLELTNAVPLPAPGAYLGVAVVAAQTIVMKGAEFTDYLVEEGLDDVVAARRSAGETDDPTIERYGRYAKIALRSGAGSAAHLTRPVGLRAEFVPSGDPTSIRAGQSLTVQLLIGGTPAAGATVFAAAPGTSVRAITDTHGRATFVIDRDGPWLIKSIHMTRLPAGSPAQWESDWATLTFHTAH